MLPLRLGVCIPKGKKTRMNMPARIVGLCENSNVQIIEIDDVEDIETRGPYDVILHKVLDFYNEHDKGIDVAKTKIDRIVTYAERHPETIIIDNFEWCLRLTNRKLMVELIKQCAFTMNRTQVFLPKTLDVPDKCSYTNIKAEMNERHFKFPVLVKPHSAYFDDGSHVIALIYTMEGLKKIAKPCLIQEFCNHSGLCYKVFVIGERFHICERPSIKDLRVEAASSQSTIYFDSFRVSKTGQAYCEDLHESDPNDRVWLSSDQKPNLLDHEVVREIVARIKRCSGLYLYGFDILIEKGTKNYALIDINQFPSYKGIDDSHFPNDLLDLIKSFRKTT